MGQGHSGSVPSQSNSKTMTASPQRNKEKVRRDFDKLFADVEFRCKRSAMMNYHEAERYHKRSQLLQMVSTVIGALGVSGIASSVAKTHKVTSSSAGLAGVLALPLCGILGFVSNGSSSLAPTVAEKAKLHVQAGACWQRIGRLTRVYRVQLRHLDDDDLNSALLTTWYRETIEASEAVSRILPIRPDTYVKFEEPEMVKQRLQKRETLLRKYLDMEDAQLV